MIVVGVGELCFAIPVFASKHRISRFGIYTPRSTVGGKIDRFRINKYFALSAPSSSPFLIETVAAFAESNLGLSIAGVKTQSGFFSVEP